MEKMKLTNQKQLAQDGEGTMWLACRWMLVGKSRWKSPLGLISMHCLSKLPNHFEESRGPSPVANVLNIYHCHHHHFTSGLEPCAAQIHIIGGDTWLIQLGQSQVPSFVRRHALAYMYIIRENSLNDMSDYYIFSLVTADPWFWYMKILKKVLLPHHILRWIKYG